MIDPTIQEMQEKLKALGIDPGEWADSPGGLVSSPILERQREMLIKVRELLKDRVQADKEKMSELHATVQRLKHGGGV